MDSELEMNITDSDHEMVDDLTEEGDAPPPPHSEAQEQPSTSHVVIDQLMEPEEPASMADESEPSFGQSHQRIPSNEPAVSTLSEAASLRRASEENRDASRYTSDPALRTEPVPQAAFFDPERRIQVIFDNDYHVPPPLPPVEPAEDLPVAPTPRADRTTARAVQARLSPMVASSHVPAATYRSNAERTRPQPRPNGTVREQPSSTTQTRQSEPVYRANGAARPSREPTSSIAPPIAALCNRANAAYRGINRMLMLARTNVSGFTREAVKVQQDLAEQYFNRYHQIYMDIIEQPLSRALLDDIEDGMSQAESAYTALRTIYQTRLSELTTDRQPNRISMPPNDHPPMDVNVRLGAVNMDSFNGVHP